MIGTYDIKVNAAKPNMPLLPLFAFNGSPSSLRLLGVPKDIGNWKITRVYITTLTPDNLTTSIDCVRNGNVYVGTLQGCSTSGKVTNGFTIYADGKDENNNDVTGYCLGKGDVVIMDADPNVSRMVEKYTCRVLNELPVTPTIGDVYLTNGKIQIFNGSEWVSDTIPSKVSDLTNDAGYITASAIPSNLGAFTNDVGYVTASAIPSTVGSFTNDVGYLTSSSTTITLLSNRISTLSTNMNAKRDKTDLAFTAASVPDPNLPKVGMESVTFTFDDGNFDPSVFNFSTFTQLSPSTMTWTDTTPSEGYSRFQINATITGSSIMFDLVDNSTSEILDDWDGQQMADGYRYQSYSISGSEYEVTMAFHMVTSRLVTMADLNEQIGDALTQQL